MIKGAKYVQATSPTGVVVTTLGVALEIARKVNGSGHFTVHEMEDGYNGALVAIIPRDWHITLVLNQ